MIDALLARPEPRVVTVSSGAHRTGRINFDDLHSEVAVAVLLGAPVPRPR